VHPFCNKEFDPICIGKEIIASRICIINLRHNIEGLETWNLCG
jgi:hypothetical protein